jgi:hypothetical protein
VIESFFLHAATSSTLTSIAHSLLSLGRPAAGQEPSPRIRADRKGGLARTR